MILRSTYVARNGTTSVRCVDSRIFSLTYYTHCMECGFCGDRCCEYGVDVDVPSVLHLMKHGDHLRPYIGRHPHDAITWDWTQDTDFPGGVHTRTKVVDGACAFKNRKGRGCGIHAYCADHEVDYHLLKPMVSVLFPLTFHQGLLLPSPEASTGSLVCSGQGLSLYDGVREELLYYFDAGLVAELDALKLSDFLQDLSHVKDLP